ncbi:MAG: tetratricopeptide repeat protein [Acidobacteria bacterium]|nr:tetratricopeptide repeat protein [Acidobacteriota bacterium]
MLALPLPTWAQQGQVLLESNEQLFSVLAALNAAGYDTGITVDTGDQTREGVRAALAKENIPILPEIRKFYEAHRIPGRPGAELGQYVSLALFLGPPPDFHFTIAQTDLPPDASAVAGLVPLLTVFYKQADLIDLWARAQINYRTRIEQYSPLVRKAIELTDAYLRFPAGAYLGRTYTIYVDLLGAPNQVQARIYGSNYYLVITPSKKFPLDDIRHQYLHFLLDPLAVKYAPQIHQAIALAAIARKAPALKSDFKEDFSLLVTECLIRAAELRIDKLPEFQARKRVNQLASSGLILVPYFYDALEDYEKQEASMTVYYRQMIQGIKPLQEEARLANIKFTKPAAPVAAAPEGSEVQQLLDKGDNAIYEGKYDEAHTAFEQVIAKNPQNSRALFGLAVVASNTRKPDIARKYFEETLKATHDLRLVTWSHIYLGRIYDLSGERMQALAQYRAASLTAGAYPEALRAVESGLKIPYGAEPQGQN